ncbi:NAD(P)-dependent oxidoreductase [Pelagibacterium montanilacus]|uniref:NAD(P)-dependent oxidoreductase n=1 Tax=Pelagibacterium montanilacus TaxID=2185280 RepID=UPI000F8E5A5B|nr:NAD(P)-dependent oxidoreductase [Pelagibacterium montanilacus]
MSTSEKPVVGVIGLGIMGIAYARNLIKSGFVVNGFDLSEKSVNDLKGSGGTPLSSAREVAEKSDHLLIALPSVAALDAVAAEIAPALRSGMVVAEMGTLPIDVKERARDVIEASGAKMLDSPVSGTGAQAAVGDLVVFSSGEEAGSEAMRVVFEGLGRDVRHVGEFGAGMKLKYVANLLVSIHNLATAEALLLAEKSGLDLQTTFDVISSGAGNSRMFEVRGPLMVSGEYEPATMKMDVYIKDVMLILEHARNARCPVPLMAATLPFYSAALAQGRDKQDTAALFEVIRQLSENTQEKT